MDVFFNHIKDFCSKILTDDIKDEIYTQDNLSTDYLINKYIVNIEPLIIKQIKKKLVELDKITENSDISIGTDKYANQNRIVGIKVQPNSPSNIKEKSIFIVLNNSLNTCWERFVLLKELCSLYLRFDNTFYDDKEITFQDYESAINNAFEQSKDFSNINNSLNTNCELFAILAAVKVMIPNIEKTLGYLYDIKNSHFDIARKLLIPEIILSYSFKNGYLELLKD